MFIVWLEKNKEVSKAQKLTYMEFLLQYMYKEYIQKWVWSKHRCTIDRINFISPPIGELFHLQNLWNRVKGLICHKYIRTLDDNVHKTFKEACYALDLLNKNTKYVVVIKEALS